MRNHFKVLIAWMLGLIFSVVITAAVALAQNAPRPQAATTKSIPRTADGKPDLSGTWSYSGGGGLAPMLLTAWGIERFNYNKVPKGSGARPELDPILHCYRPGLARIGPPLQVPGPPYAERVPSTLGAIEIVRAPHKLMVIYEYNHEVRSIFTDGRPHPKDLEATGALRWNGHSIGSWDGDTLTVDTVGLRNESWLDNQGHEFSTQMHVVERFRRIDAGTLEIERTLTDPVALAKPYVTRVTLKLTPNLTFQENVTCNQYYERHAFYGDDTVMGINEHPWQGPDRSTSSPPPIRLEDVFGGGGQTQTIEGVLSDATCGAKHKIADAVQCTLACVREGNGWALVVGDKVYALEGNLIGAVPFAGGKAKITGRINGNKVLVEKVEAAN